MKYIYSVTKLTTIHVLSLQNAALCVVFGLSLFAGGVANTIYSANNAGTIDDMGNLCDHSDDITADICDALKTVRDSEAATAVSWKTLL